LGARAESLVFGTALDGAFEHKVNDLCVRLGEGIQFDNPDTVQPTAQDDRLDIVAWKSFTDRNTSKLIAFGQCKTGTSWTSANLSELQPEVFCKKWFRRQPIHTPVRMFFCSLYISLDQWNTRANDGGIVFDRFRILDFLPEGIENDLLQNIMTWSTEGIGVLSHEDQ
jgi:hypothetical protein